MEPKFRMRISAAGLVGLVFLPCGLLFLAMGILFPAESIKGSPALFRGIFLGFGGVFSLLGTAFVVQDIRKNLKSKKLLESGNYIYASFTQASLVTNVRINGRNPYQAEFQYTDGLGMIHMFYGRQMMTDPTPLLTGKQVRVYVDPENYDNYYVDIDSVLTYH